MKKDTVIQLASKAAAVFVDEFPGETVSGDWDSEAWAIDSANQATTGADWELYRSTLVAEIARLNK